MLPPCCPSATAGVPSRYRHPEQLSRFELYCRQISGELNSQRKNKAPAATSSPVFEPEVGFHTPRLSDGPDIVAGWAEKAGPRCRLGSGAGRCHLDQKGRLGRSRSPAVHAAGARILDLGPGDILTRLDRTGDPRPGAPGIVPAATRGGQRNLLTVGATPAPPGPGRATHRPCPPPLTAGPLLDEVHLLTGRSPDPARGHDPDHRGSPRSSPRRPTPALGRAGRSGQATEEIFGNRIEQMAGLLEPGRHLISSTRCSSILTCGSFRWRKAVGAEAPASPAPIDGAGSAPAP